MERLVRKNGATRRKVGRCYLYSPVMSQEALREAAVRQLVESLFDGSPAALKAYLADGARLQKPAASEVKPRLDGMDDDRLDAVLL
jgi:predicted transcriptional regulator